MFDIPNCTVTQYIDHDRKKLNCCITLNISTSAALLDQNDRLKGEIEIISNLG